jgi:hypothetical protein
MPPAAIYPKHDRKEIARNDAARRQQARRAFAAHGLAGSPPPETNRLPGDPRRANHHTSE